MKSVLILVLAITLGWTLWRLGDVERQRYVMLVGTCERDAVGLWDFQCLETSEPRTSRLWDIAYGLMP